MKFKLVITIAVIVLWGVAPAWGQTLSDGAWQQLLLQESSDSLAKEAAILGDARRGAIVFFQSYMACSKCHVAGAVEKPLAPDLTKLPKDVTNAQLVEAVVTPSKAIREGFETHTILTTAGKTLQGLIAEESDTEVVLREPLPTGKQERVAKTDIESRAKSVVSPMPDGQIQQLASRQQFLDLVRYLIELRDGGLAKARELQPDPLLIAAAPLPEYENHLDHRGLISRWGDESFERGQAIYLRVCANCHGTHDRAGSLPTSLRFAEGKFKNGSDPLAMYQTLTRGFGFMTPQTWMVPRQKYDVIHYIREAYLRSHNASQFVAVDAGYLDKLPRGNTLGPEPSNIEPWAAMDYGPSLTNTYELERGNFAYKGIAMRLDAGPGGVSRGQNWLIFDHDTLRMAGAWQGKGFVDWHGIHFDGQHGVHPKVVGAIVASNPVGPGWAHPETGSLVDPRPKARDGRPFGPLPREWAKLRGMYAHGGRTLIAYTVGNTPVLESPELFEVTGTDKSVMAAYGRHLELGPRAKPLTLVVATRPDPRMRGPVAGQPWSAPAAVVQSAPAATGASLAFAGQTRVDIAKPGDFDLTTKDYSVLARVRTTGDGTIFSQAASEGPWTPDGKALFVRDGRLVFDIGWVGAVTGRTRVDDGQWHLVGLTWRAADGDVRLYVDGKPAGQGKLKPKKTVKGFAVRLGFAAEDFPADSPFSGEMSEAAFYQRVLSAAEIAAAKAESGFGLKEKPLAAWQLNQAKEGTVVDVAGNGHNGKIVRADAGATSERGPLIAGVIPSAANTKWRWDDAGRLLLDIPAGNEPLKLNVWVGNASSVQNAPQECANIQTALTAQPAVSLASLTNGGPRRWKEILTTKVQRGSNNRPFAVDILTPPDSNPWLAQLRLSGLDFLEDGDRVLVCSWDGDVWLVSGLSSLADEKIAAPELKWQRIASGLFQPLGIKRVGGKTFVTCRDQIVILNDLNGDGETDYYECFNNDHQVTEHFHEFAMGLQADAAGNLYYAKSARHALTALVPHHGTLLRVSADGRRTDILANGFRAANGVCLNPDGSFIVTDQEGHWNPKNRINWVTVDEGKPPRFYGNMFGYHNRTDSSDSAMEPPLCWITNEFDRSPAELLWVTSDKWGPLKGSLLNLSYGYGKVFAVPHERVDGQVQGGMIELPMPAFPTGVMRGRFHPQDGQLYLCGMFAWAGNATQSGGFYRLRYTGQPVELPVALKATKNGLVLGFTGELARDAAIDPKNYAVKVWSLKRSANYGSQHINEHPVEVRGAQLGEDGKTVTLDIAELGPTWGMEIRYELKNKEGKPLTGKIHNTIHRLGE